MIEYYSNYYCLIVSVQLNGLKSYIELGMNFIFFHILLRVKIILYLCIKMFFNLWEVIKVQVKCILDLVLFPKSDFLVFIVRAQSFEALFGRAMM
jgi:hypothetical protein